VGDD
jgi:hypothetical protein